MTSLTSRLLRLVMASLLLLATITSVQPSTQEERVATALETTLDYILANHKRIHLDGLFGVVFAQAHLDAILKSDLSPKERLRLQSLKTKADLIYALVKPQLYKGDAEQVIFVENVIDPRLWQREIDFRLGLITPTAPSLRTPFEDGVDSYDRYLAYLGTSNMSETQSDQCLLELIGSGSRTNQHGCRLSDVCRRHMVDAPYYDPTYGITHRLLFLHIGLIRNCTINREWYTAQTQNYCSYILWEATMNAHFGFLDELDDILLEQMTLCGYEGFAEFLQAEFVEHVLDAQTAHGCFGIPLLSTGAANHRRRRSANLISYGCNDHTTGLGASTLALILRYLKLRKIK